MEAWAGGCTHDPCAGEKHCPHPKMHARAYLLGSVGWRLHRNGGSQQGLVKQAAGRRPGQGAQGQRLPNEVRTGPWGALPSFCQQAGRAAANVRRGLPWAEEPFPWFAPQPHSVGGGCHSGPGPARQSWPRWMASSSDGHLPPLEARWMI